MTTIRNGNPNRASVLSSDPNNPTPTLITSVTRETYAAIERLARAQNLSKAAYLRKLVVEHVEENGWDKR